MNNGKKIKPHKIKPFLWRDLYPKPIIGVDEVGRGCLAGPVYAAAVILSENFDTSGLKDSKKLSEKQREKLCTRILKTCCVGIGFATVKEIEKMNILWASLLAMRRAVDSLAKKSAHVLVDGNKKIPGLGLVQTSLIQGDMRADPVAAASIVAKVHRDQLMKRLEDKYPGYGFAEHKGYGTVLHKQAIREKGVLDIHRSGFRSVKEYQWSGKFV